MANIFVKYTLKGLERAILKDGYMIKIFRSDRNGLYVVKLSLSRKKVQRNYSGNTLISTLLKANSYIGGQNQSKTKLSSDTSDFRGNCCLDLWIQDSNKIHIEANPSGATLISGSLIDITSSRIYSSYSISLNQLLDNLNNQLETGNYRNLPHDN